MAMRTPRRPARWTRQVKRRPGASSPSTRRSFLEAYRRAAFALLDPDAPRRLRIVYTPLHGVGGQVVPELLETAGFGPVSVVAAQGAPDPDSRRCPFPTRRSPGRSTSRLPMPSGWEPT